MNSSVCGPELKTVLQKQERNSRAVLVASVEDHEGVWLSKEVLFIQLVGTKLHGGVILHTVEKEREKQWNEKKN